MESPKFSTLYGIPQPDPSEDGTPRFVVPEDPIRGMLQDTRTKTDDRP